MKINNITFKSANKYVVTIEGKKYPYYEDIIIKYSLFNKKEIDDNLFKQINDDQNFYVAYYKMIGFISFKMRTETEIRNKLRSYHLGKSISDKIINKLKEEKYLDSKRYLKSYINDQINLTLNGPEKIRRDLKKIGYNDEEIENDLDVIDKEIWINKANKIIQKKLKANHNLSCKLFNIKIKDELRKIGYNDSVINNIEYIEFDDSKIKEKVYQKYIRIYKKKYNKEKLNEKIKQKMWEQGFME